MSKKDNFNQAMYDMFGVGKEPVAEKAAPAAEPAAEPAAKPAVKPAEPSFAAQSRVIDIPVAAPAPAAPVESRKPVSSTPVAPAVTYLAPGVVMEGKLKATGDVEIAGDFKGEITTDGSVIVRNFIDAAITAGGLQVLGSTLNGDTHIKGQVLMDENSVINGNVFAGDLVCSATVNGDLDVEGDLTLDSHARIKGNIKTGSLTMARGARISGHIEMTDSE